MYTGRVSLTVSCLAGAHEYDINNLPYSKCEPPEEELQNSKRNTASVHAIDSQPAEKYRQNYSSRVFSGNKNGITRHCTWGV